MTHLQHQYQHHINMSESPTEFVFPAMTDIQFGSPEPSERSHVTSPVSADEDVEGLRVFAEDLPDADEMRVRISVLVSSLATRIIQSVGTLLRQLHFESQFEFNSQMTEELELLGQNYVPEIVSMVKGRLKDKGYSCTVFMTTKILRYKVWFSDASDADQEIGDVSAEEKEEQEDEESLSINEQSLVSDFESLKCTVM